MAVPKRKTSRMRRGHRRSADALTTPTGLAYTVIQSGHGTRHARYGDTVVIDYAGWTRDGKPFDSSFEHGAPGHFTLDASLPLGLNEALMQMVEGERRVVWIPKDLAYGRRSDRPEGMLIVDVRLLSIEPR